MRKFRLINVYADDFECVCVCVYILPQRVRV